MKSRGRPSPAPVPLAAAVDRARRAQRSWETQSYSSGADLYGEQKTPRVRCLLTLLRRAEWKHKARAPLFKRNAAGVS
ncbi:MAG TPA: hypothetical protein VNO43_17275 [Candidatus Eisenbacteria bacterium]|nr:hypothetical protein [Candidatus Eisenbacteria bacterium]